MELPNVKISYWLNQKTKNLFLRTGYRLQKSPRVLWNKNSRDLLVEVVGAPGSGKTTTLEEYYQKNRAEIVRLRPRVHLNRALARGRIHPSHLAIIQAYAKTQGSWATQHATHEVSYHHMELLIARLHQAAYYSDMGGLVVEDEGLFKTFPQLMLAHLENQGNSSPSCLQERAFVIFKTDPAYHFELHRKRKIGRLSSKRKVDALNHKFQESLPRRLERYAASVSLWSRFERVFQEFDVPFLVIDPSRGLALNVKEIERFLGEIAGSPHG